MCVYAYDRLWNQEYQKESGNLKTKRIRKGEREKQSEKERRRAIRREGERKIE